MRQFSFYFVIDGVATIALTYDQAIYDLPNAFVACLKAFVAHVKAFVVSSKTSVCFLEEVDLALMISSHIMYVCIQYRKDSEPNNDKGLDDIFLSHKMDGREDTQYTEDANSEECSERSLFFFRHFFERNGAIFKYRHEWPQ